MLSEVVLITQINPHSPFSSKKERVSHHPAFGVYDFEDLVHPEIIPKLLNCRTGVGLRQNQANWNNLLLSLDKVYDFVQEIKLKSCYDFSHAKERWYELVGVVEHNGTIDLDKWEIEAGRGLVDVKSMTSAQLKMALAQMMNQIPRHLVDSPEYKDLVLMIELSNRKYYTIKHKEELRNLSEIPF